MSNVKASEVLASLALFADDKQREILMRFFKTGPGQYGEGDKFFGIKVPVTRQIVKEARGKIDFNEIDKLLDSEWHEARLAGFLLLVEMIKSVTPRRKDSPLKGAEERERIAQFYLEHARKANNWDLVDLSCPQIVGTYLLYPKIDGNLPDSAILDRLAESDNLWEQRISIVSTFALIRAGRFDETLRIASKLLSHPHDLIHKSVGWMLREVGKKSQETLLQYLNREVHRMPRTALRYAIERFHEHERQYWLHR